MCLLLVHSFSLAIGIAHASHGLHVRHPYGVATTSAVSHVGPANYDDAILTPLPNPPSPTSFGVQVQTGAVPSLSMPHQVGFSVEHDAADDNSETSGYTASISINGTAPSQVRVKYLPTSSGTQKYDITWSGQTSDDAFGSNGRPVRDVNVQTIQCDQTNHVCNVKVTTSGAALVFPSDQGLAMTTDLTDTSTTVDLVVLTSDDIADAPTDKNQGGDFDGTSLALSSLGALVAVCAFVCIESLLSYAITDNTPFRLLSDMTKNAPR